MDIFRWNKMGNGSVLAIVRHISFHTILCNRDCLPPLQRRGVRDTREGEVTFPRSHSCWVSSSGSYSQSLWFHWDVDQQATTGSTVGRIHHWKEKACSAVLLDLVNKWNTAGALTVFSNDHPFQCPGKAGWLWCIRNGSSICLSLKTPMCVSELRYHGGISMAVMLPDNDLSQVSCPVALIAGE